MEVKLSPQYRRSPRFLKQLTSSLDISGSSVSEAAAGHNTQENKSFEFTPPSKSTKEPRRSKRISQRTKRSGNNQVDKVQQESTMESILHNSTTKVDEVGHDAAILIERILHYDKLPKWMQVDPHIKHGYRKELNSFLDCFRSLFYFHNEFVNTWSHLLPAFFFLALLQATDYSILYGEVEVSGIDNLAIQFYIAGTAACLFFSALFHGTNCHSPDVARRFLKLDYLGIVITISTTCISATFFGLYNHFQLQIIYIAVTTTCATAVFYAVLHPEADGPKAAAWRALVFTGLALSGFMPIAHVAVIEGFEGLERFPLANIAVTCGSYLIGTMIYVYRVPEKYFPGVFDVWGASHQIFHTLVAFGQIVHLLGLKRVVLMHY